MSNREVIAGPGILLRGRISDVLTTKGIVDASLELEYRQGGEWMSFTEKFRPRKVLRKLVGGWYSVVVPHVDLAARVHLGVATDFRVTVSHLLYQTTSEQLSISASDFSTLLENVDVMGEAVEFSRLSGAPFVQDVAMKPQPVMLAGIVISENDPTKPVAGADVTIAAGDSTVSTDVQGRFRFDSTPISLELEITAQKGDRNVAIKHTVDFTQRVNTTVVSLMA